MKCPSCGAEIANSRFCSYCGTQINTEMIREKELLNKEGCPRCGSTNVSFNRENQGEIRGKNSKQILHYTVGVCRDCGFTWRTDGGQTTNKRKTWLWVLGWIFIFPLPLTLILLKKKDMNAVLKYGIIAIAWVLYLIIAFSGRASNDNAKTPTDKTTPTPFVQETEDQTETEESLTEEKTTEEKTTEEKTTEEKTTEEKTTEEKTTENTSKQNVTLGMKNALGTAYDYLRFSAFSYSGLMEQLEYEGYSADEAKYAVDNCGADWFEQAAKCAESYLNYSSFSRSGLYDQLIYEGFSSEQAQYALEAVGY